MKFILFGGVGFIGTNIAKLALERGHDVMAFDNLMRHGVKENLAFLKRFPKFSFQRGDIRNIGAFDRLPTNIDCIINLAANPSVPKSIDNPVFDFEINVRGHLNVLEFARKNGRIPVIFASSNKVYTDKINTISIKETKTRYEINNRSYIHGFSEDIDVDGNDGYTNSPYGSGKLSAEKYTREYWKHYGVPVIINRMSCIYGLFQKGVEEQGWVDWFLRAKKMGKPITIYGSGKQVRDVLFGNDVAALYLEEASLMKRLSGCTFNVGGGAREGFHVSLLETIAILNDTFPGPALKTHFALWRESDQRIYISNIRRVKELTGWKPSTPLIKGLRAMWRKYV
ncbi:MAG: NAD-dependent epimerase/dehydratase family protein [Bacteroidota bacterium]